jgi:hypothetical protein
MGVVGLRRLKASIIADSGDSEFPKKAESEKEFSVSHILLSMRNFALAIRQWADQFAGAASVES